MRPAGGVHEIDARYRDRCRVGHHDPALKFNGYIAGAEGHLTYAEDVYRYMRALEAASPRVKVFSIGKTEEGREMIVVAVANEKTIRDLDHYRDITRRLADPRKLSEDEARRLIAEGKPMYYLTGAMHSPETGSPEMLMELAYRLAVEETPFVKSIRDNVITLITPVLEVDGRDRVVDLWNYRKANPTVPTPPLVYWGHYVAHDDNRDNMGLSLALSRNVLHTYFDWHPQVIHDLHESVPFIYISTGTGPYNSSLDPLMIDEWHRMAYHEVDELTRRGLPGVWTHGFYDGWAPNYMFWVGMGHNTIGRFYETFGNRWPTTENRVVRGQSDRTWFRPNPPLPQVRWSLRNNVNYQESGLLFALHDMSEHHQAALEEFWTLGKRSVAKASNEGPAAWVFDGAQKRQGQLHDLMKLLRMHGIEVNVSDDAFTMKTNWPPVMPKSEHAEETPEPAAKAPVDAAAKFGRGSFVIRMDQPYSRLADAMLDVQYVRGEERLYDDTGWTLGYLKNVECKRVANADVLKVPMHEWTGDGAQPSVPKLFAVENNADADLARFRWSQKNAHVLVADEELTAGGKKLAPGTLIVSGADSAPAVSVALDAAPAIKTHESKLPRIAVLHTWWRTQDEGWYRIALDSMGVPYTYMSTQEVSRTPNLRERFDVILFPPCGSSPQEIVNGMPPGPPLPWKKTALTPNLGVDQTEDMRPGLGLSGVASLLRSIFKVGVTDQSDRDTRPTGRGGKNDPDVPQGRAFVPLPERAKPAPAEEGFQMPEDAPYNFEPYMPHAEDRPRVIVAFAKKADQLLLSGMLEGGEEIAGKPAIIDSPRGHGHILLFANNPMWRANTQGSYALVMNAIMSWDRLR